MFIDRRDAGRRLAAEVVRHLGPAHGDDIVVLGLPRGGVIVADEVARALGAPLDAILVRKLGVPSHPELAMGAIAEGGVHVLDEEVRRANNVDREALADVEQRERWVLDRVAESLRGARPPAPVYGRTVVVVDDGIATGATARAACAVVRQRGAARVVLATPVAPPDWTDRLAGVADEFVVVTTPERYHAVGQVYEHFDDVPDHDVTECLDHALAPPRPPVDDDVLLFIDDVIVPGHLTVPVDPIGVVVFAHGSGSGHHSPRNQHMAHALHDARVATLLVDLLTAEESRVRANNVDIGLLGRRLVAATERLRGQAALASVPVGYVGAATGAAAAFWAATHGSVPIAAVVSRGGRPDMADGCLADVHCPTLLVVGGDDEVALAVNRQAVFQLHCETRLAIVPGASHFFTEPGTLDTVANLARDWFVRHLAHGAMSAR